jgi:NAD(P)-dependent dehydrogenase (short-subunit alcohol dehydrogenase family)
MVLGFRAPFSLSLDGLHPQEQGANVTANSAHPGIILTNIVRYSPSLGSQDNNQFRLP